MTRKYVAFCPELKTVVTSEDVWELLFGASASSKTLTFYCPEETCRARLTPWNIKRFFSSSEGSFRLYPRVKHQDGCGFSRKTSFKKKGVKKHFSVGEETLPCDFEDLQTLSISDAGDLLVTLGLPRSGIWNREGRGCA